MSDTRPILDRLLNRAGLVEPEAAESIGRINAIFPISRVPSARRLTGH
jgi:hypothetical protein